MPLSQLKILAALYPCKLVLVLAFYFLSPNNTLLSQQENYNIENFFINEGFPITRVLDINQDRNGLLWLCSDKQLNTFNGSQFELILEFNKINYFPNELLFDNNGNKWLIKKGYSTSLDTPVDINDIIIYNEKNQRLDIGEYLKIGDFQVTRVTQCRKGIITFKAGNEFYQFDQESCIVSVPYDINDILFKNENILVANSKNNGIIIDWSTGKQTEIFNGNLIAHVDNFENSLFIRFTNGQLYHYQLRNQKLSLINNISFLPEKSWDDLIVDNFGDIWIINMRTLKRYNLAGELKENFNDIRLYPALPYNTTSFIDREGNLWIGSNLGLNKISRSKKEIFKTASSFLFSTRNIYQLSDKELLISTYRGRYIYNINSTAYSETKTSDLVFDLLEEDGYYYTIDQLHELKKETFQPNIIHKQKSFLQTTIKDRIPASLLKLSNGKKYLLSDNSIYEFDKDLSSSLKLRIDEDETKLYQFYEIDQELYVATNKGVFVYDTNFNLKRRLLKSQSIRLIHQDKTDKNILWLSTDFELIKYNIEKEAIQTYDSTLGFINTNFTAIQEDENGNLWLPSFSGLNMFNKQTELNQVYFTDDGISNNEFNYYSNTVLNDETLVFGSISGLTFVDPKTAGNDTIDYPKIQIHSCKILARKNNNRIDVTEKVNKESAIIFMEHDIEANVHLSHHSYTNLKSKIFKYRIFEDLETIDKKNEPWTELINNEIQVGRKPYGNYILQYQAMSRSGIELSDVNQISLQFKKPFYKTPLAIMIGLLLFLLCVYFYFDNRSRALKDQKIELETEVSIRTQQIQKQKEELEDLISTKDKLFSILAHDLRSPLITLKNISGKINYLIKKEQPDRIIEIGKTIEDKVTNLNGFLDNILNWSLQQRGHISYNPENLNVQDCVNEILELFDDLVLEKEIKIDQEIPEGSTCFADENSIKTVFRNVIHNAIKFAPKQSIVSIKYSSGKEFDICSIKDQGEGILQSTIDAVYKGEYIKNTKGTSGEKGTGLGFFISKELMDLNKGKIVFNNNQGQGTTVELLLPVSP